MADYDMSDFKTRLRDLIGEAVASFFTEDELEETVNETLRDIAAKTGCYQIIDATLATVFETRTVSLVSSAYRAAAVEYNETFLREILAKQCGRFPADDNIPRFFYNIPGGSIGIDRLPDGAYALTAYTQDEPQAMTTPAGLGYASTNANVATVAFDYWIAGVKYAKGALPAGTALTGDTVPGGKFGAWRLEIGSNTVIDVIPASGNGTGYTTKAQSLAGLPNVSANHVEVGTVALFSTIAFIPGTSGLLAGTVTPYFEDSGAIPKIPRQFWPPMIIKAFARSLRKQGRIMAAEALLDVYHGELRFFAYDSGSQYPDGWADYRDE